MNKFARRIKPAVKKIAQALPQNASASNADFLRLRSFLTSANVKIIADGKPSAALVRVGASHLVLHS